MTARWMESIGPSSPSAALAEKSGYISPDNRSNVSSPDRPARARECRHPTPRRWMSAVPSSSLWNAARRISLRRALSRYMRRFPCSTCFLSWTFIVSHLWKFIVVRVCALDCSGLADEALLVGCGVQALADEAMNAMLKNLKLPDQEKVEVTYTTRSTPPVIRGGVWHRAEMGRRMVR